MCNYEYISKERKGDLCPYSNYAQVTFNSKKYCIFHAHLVDKNKEFWEAFLDLVDKLKDKEKKLEEWDFEGFVFPNTGKRFEREKFPKNVEINFRYARFNDNASFNETHFSGGVDFSNAVFLGETKLSNAHYYVKTSFANTEFKGVSYILNAYFHSDVDFSGAKFYKNTYFRKSEFLEGSEAKFNEAKFLKDSYVEFNRAVFTGVAKFNKAEFTGVVDFTGVKFLNNQGGAEFVDAKFLGETCFKGTIFESYATFHGAIFEKKVDFWGPTFSKGSNFKNVKFFDRVDFTNTNFSGETYFNFSKFSGEVYFSDAKLEDVKFHSTNFSAPVSFKGAYVKKIDFDRSTFAIQPSIGNLNALSKDITIINLVCDTSIEFSQGYKISEDDKKYNDIEEPLNITVRGGSYGGEFFISPPLSCFNCERCTFTGILIIDPTIKQENNSELPELKFERVNMLGKTVINKVKVNNITNSVIEDILILRDADLKRASLEGTSELRKIDFISVVWPKLNRRLCKYIRSLRELDGLYDELKQFCKENSDDHDFEGNPVDAPKPKDCIPDEKERDKVLKNLSEMYRAVASSFESRQRYGSAGPFKVGEFDMRKWMMKDVSGLERFVLRVYRFISSYGESVVKPFVWLILIWLIPAFCYSLFGELIDVSNILETNSICFTKALSLSFQACLPVKTSLVDRLVESWSLLPSIQRGLFAIFTAFFLFALRRKAKR